MLTVECGNERVEGMVKTPFPGRQVQILHDLCLQEHNENLNICQAAHQNRGLATSPSIKGHMPKIQGHTGL